MSWMFKRNLEIDKETQILVRNLIKTIELLEARISKLENQTEKEYN